MHILITRCIRLGFLDSLFIVEFKKNGFSYMYSTLYTCDAYYTHINLQFSLQYICVCVYMYEIVHRQWKAHAQKWHM